MILHELLQKFGHVVWLIHGLKNVTFHSKNTLQHCWLFKLKKKQDLPIAYSNDCCDIYFETSKCKHFICNI